MNREVVKADVIRVSERADVIPLAVFTKEYYINSWTIYIVLFEKLPNVFGDFDGVDNGAPGFGTVVAGLGIVVVAGLGIVVVAGLGIVVVVELELVCVGDWFRLKYNSIG
jgi:hypothetical protein